MSALEVGRLASTRARNLLGQVARLLRLVELSRRDRPRCHDLGAGLASAESAVGGGAFVETATHGIVSRLPTRQSLGHRLAALGFDRGRQLRHRVISKGSHAVSLPEQLTDTPFVGSQNVTRCDGEGGTTAPTAPAESRTDARPASEAVVAPEAPRSVHYSDQDGRDAVGGGDARGRGGARPGDQVREAAAVVRQVAARLELAGSRPGDAAALRRAASVLEQRAGAWDSAMPAAIARETGLRRRLAELVQRVAELEGRREA